MKKGKKKTYKFISRLLRTILKPITWRKQLMLIKYHEDLSAWYLRYAGLDELPRY